jgi:hypothetical protein
MVVGFVLTILRFGPVQKPMRINTSKGKQMACKTKLVLDMMYLTKCDEETFFRTAHFYILGCDADVTNAVVQFKQHAIVPDYVQIYAKEVWETTL